MFVEYEPNEKHSKKGALISDSSDDFSDCGFIIPEDVLIVDVDNVSRETIDAIRETFKVYTKTIYTNRGAHFYFKKPIGFRGATGVCQLGFEVEYKHSKNTNSITVKRNGIAREVINENLLIDLPNIFTKSKKHIDLMDLQEGEGRNNSMYKHRLALHDQKNYVELLRFINKYVLSEPLPDKELETIMRDVKVSSDENAYDLASYIINKYSTCRFQNELYFKIKDNYENDNDKFRQILFAEYPQTLTRLIKEIEEQVIIRSKIYNNAHEFDVKLKNGTLSKGKFIPMVSSEFSPHKVKLNYNKHFYSC